MFYETKDIYDALEPLHFICKISGIAPYSLKCVNKKRKYKITYFDIILSVIPNIFFNISFIFGLRSCSKQYNILITLITVVIQRYLNIIMYLVNYFAALIHSKKIIKSLSIIVKYDSYFKKYSNNITHKSIRNRVLKILLIALISNGVINIAFDIVSIFINGTPVLCSLLYMISYTVTLIVECQLFIYLIELAERMKVLKEIIRVTLAKMPPSNGVNSKKLFVHYKQAEMLKRCTNIYNEFIEVGIAFNESFQSQILIKLFQSFIYILTSLFYFLVDMKIGPEIDYLYDYCSFILSAIMNFSEILAIIYAFSQANNEV